jgi:hypothetical protein
MGAGFRKKPEENNFVQQGGVIISSGPEEIRDPNVSADREAQTVDFIGTALVVKDAYKPEYQFVETHQGNHAFRIKAPRDNSFEYLLSSAWSEGAVYKNAKEFTDYIMQTSLEYNNPLEVRFTGRQVKE